MKSVRFFIHSQCTQNDGNKILFTVCYFTDMEDAERMRKALPTREVRRVDIYRKYHEK